MNLRQHKRRTLARMIGRPPIWCRRYQIRYLKAATVQVEICVHIAGRSQWPPLCTSPEVFELMDLQQRALGELLLACNRVTVV